MKEAGVEANTVVYNSALDACGRAGKPKVAAKLLRKMGEAGECRARPSGGNNSLVLVQRLVF